MTSWSQRIVPMLPQQTVQPRNKVAYTAAPLCPPERGDKSSDPCGDGDKFYAVFTSIVVMTDHDTGRNDRVFLGQRFCWSGLEVIGNYPGPTRRTPMRRNITTASGGVFGNVGPAGRTSNQARCAIPFPALDSCGGKVMPGLLCPVLMNGVSSIPILELKGNSIEGIHHPWMCFSMLHGVHVVCQALAPLAISTGTVCRQGSAPPHCWWVGGR